MDLTPEEIVRLRLTLSSHPREERLYIPFQEGSKLGAEIWFILRWIDDSSLFRPDVFEALDWRKFYENLVPA